MAQSVKRTVNRCKTKPPRRACQAFGAVAFCVRYVDYPPVGPCVPGVELYSGPHSYTLADSQSNIILPYVALEVLTAARLAAWGCSD